MAAVVAEEVFPASLASQRTSNPIRLIVDQLRPPEHCDKPAIALSIGDPTRYGNLKTHESVTRALCRVAVSGQFDGYPHSCGYAEARQAVADYVGVPGAQLTGEDVVLTSGASGALEIAIGALANEGDNLLLPLPGFSLYPTICDNKGIEKRFYRLLPDQGWEIDLEHIRSLKDSRTKAILVNNPSNPCGSVYTREHLQAIAAVAEELNLPIISDEIYADMAFDNDHPFIPLAALSPKMPVFSIGGIAKRFLVPGWRLGWILIHDRDGRGAEISKGIKALTTLILGPNSLIQATLPHILSSTPKAFFDDTMRMLKTHADLLFDRLSKVEGLCPIKADGTMYIMIRVDCSRFQEQISDDIQFAKLLYAEQNVCVLPGQVFGAPNFVRLVTCPSVDILSDACDRFEEFCAKYRI